jgi:hypothetical protein
MITFGQLQARTQFFSPEGSLCEKVTWTKARMLDNEDSTYKKGELVPFALHEQVELAIGQLT